MRRLLPTVLMTCLASAAVLAVGAHALPGDPSFAPGAPADGAIVPPDPSGLEVRFSCPGYRVSDAGDGFSLPGGPKDYGVTLATSARRGPDGRLADIVALGRATWLGGTECSSAVGAGGSSRPQETPGTYYWQVWRLCTDCAGGYEVGPTRKLVVRAAVAPVLTVPGKAFAGFPVFAVVTVTRVPDRAAVDVQALRGGAWQRVGRGTVLRGRGEAVVTLGGGRQTLRAVLRVGAQEVVSKQVVVVVGPASAAVVAIPAGPYRGTVGTGTRSARFTVAGRTVTGFSAQVPMLCPGIEAGQFTTQVGTALVGRIAIAPDGSFVGVATSASTGIRVRGRLQGGRVVGGRVELSVGTCVGSTAFAAKRA